MEPKPMATPNLSGLIKSKPRPSAPTVPASPEPQTVIQQPAGDKRGKSLVQKPAVARASEGQTAEPVRPRRAVGEKQPPARYTRSISLYLPRSIHAALAKQAAASGMSRTAIILRAVNAHHQDLSSWLSTDESRPEVSAEGLFDVPQDARSTEPVVQTALRVTDAQLNAMDALAETMGIKRSHVMVAALRAELHLSR